MTYTLFSNKKTTGKFDNKLVMKSFFILLVLAIPFNIIHEVGHAIPCYTEGKEFKMNIGLLGSSLNCLGDVDNKTIFRASGGLLAFVVALIPYVILRKTIDRYPFVSIVLLSMAVSQLGNMILETMLYDNYITNGFVSMITINVIQFGSFTYFVYYFTKKQEKRDD